jgi:hypothetical protein
LHRVHMSDSECQFGTGQSTGPFTASLYPRLASAASRLVPPAAVIVIVNQTPYWRLDPPLVLACLHPFVVFILSLLLFVCYPSQLLRQWRPNQRALPSSFAHRASIQVQVPHLTQPSITARDLPHPPSLLRPVELCLATNISNTPLTAVFVAHRSIPGANLRGHYTILSAQGPYSVS